MSKRTSGQLLKKIRIEGVIIARTGLHIGGTNLGMAIGGADATVVRNPFTNQPYIPGSSLKGKMRSLIEKLEGKFGPPQDSNVRNAPYTELDGTSLVPEVFGTLPDKMGKDESKIQPPSRIIVRDCMLKNAKELLNMKNNDMPYTEVKTEVVLDRITAAATPRSMERVPAGAEFEMSIILNVYQNDKEEDMIKKVLEGLHLLANDYLGGKGSRGSGQVDVKVRKFDFKDKSHYENGSSWAPYSNANIQLPVEINDLPKA